MIDVAIRFDDPSAIIDHALERELVRILAEQNACATFPVIPYGDRLPLWAEQMAHQIEAQRCGTVEIAQHGYSHESCIEGNGNPSEFTGTDPVGQSREIADGKTILSQIFGVTIGVFVPPFNTFDQATDLALEQQGFNLGTLAKLHDARTWHAAVQRSRWTQKLHWRLLPFLPKRCLMTRSLWRYLRFPERLLYD